MNKKSKEKDDAILVENNQESKTQQQNNFQNKLYSDNLEKRLDDFKFYLKLILGIVGGVSFVVITLNIISFDKILSLRDEEIEKATNAAITATKDSINIIKNQIVNELNKFLSDAKNTFENNFKKLQIDANNRANQIIEALEKKKKQAEDKYWLAFKKSAIGSGGKPSIEDINKIPDADAAKLIKDQLDKGKIITEEIIDQNRTLSELNKIKNDLQNENSTIRSSAAKLLSSYIDPKIAVSLLSERLEKEQDWLVRYTIVESLAKIGTEDAKNVLIKVRDQKYRREAEEVRNAAERALQNL